MKVTLYVSLDQVDVHVCHCPRHLAQFFKSLEVTLYMMLDVHVTVPVISHNFSRESESESDIVCVP